MAINSLPGLVDLPSGSCSSPNEGGCARYANPLSVGTHYFYVFQQSQRDADNDGIENSLDTCPFASTAGYNPRGSDSVNDPDGDMLPGGGPAGGCDPSPGVNVGSGNHDGDVAGANQWLNAGDNCPLVANGTQAESESAQPYTVAAKRGGPKTDGIGDACESNDTVADGHFHTVLAAMPKCIGGTDNDGDGWCTQATGFPYGAGSASLSDPNDGNANVTPEHYALFVPLPVTHSGSGDAPPGSREPSQVCSDGLDNDGDGSADLEDIGCKPPNTGLGTLDTDGDGYSDEAEIHVGSDALGRCEVAGPSTSTDWPADLADAGGFSRDKVNISDLSAFTAVPRIYGTSPGPGSAYVPRFDVIPGTGSVPGTWINIADLQNISSATAPMFGDARMFGGPACTAHPAYGD